MIQIKSLSKSYGRKKAIDNIDISLEKRKIVGLLGPNGSGKTTFMKILAGMIKNYKGQVSILGRECGIESRELVSYLPDVNHLYDWMKVKDALMYYEDMFKDFNKEKAIELLKSMELKENEKVTSLSKGMKEKLCITLALSRECQLYVFDEPLGGIDPLARKQVMSAILNNLNEDSTIIISTHQVADVEKMFDEVIFIDKGRILGNFNAEDVRVNEGISVNEKYIEIYSKKEGALHD